MAHNLIYAGIGARSSPAPVQAQMKLIAEQLAPTGWLLRSGHADGADKAFERGANLKEIHLPWKGYNKAPLSDPSYIIPRASQDVESIAAAHHPVWDRLTTAVKLMMCRNVTIILGSDLESHAKMVICWTPNAALVGGTAHGIRVANGFDIPVFNIADPEDQVKLCKFVLAF